MKVLVVGSGGREHALCWALARSPSVDAVIATPGSPGIAEVARCLPAENDAERVALAEREGVDLVVIGPEAPLAAGLADALRDAGIATFGPGAAGARLEASKSWAKAFMERHGVPTARADVARDLADAQRIVAERGAPIVVKDAHLAAGKGVTVADTVEAAHGALDAIFAREGAEVVLEEKLMGRELSLLVVTDGRGWVTLPLARDYKRALDGDRGPMTGGMGTVAPIDPFAPGEREALEREVIDATLAGLQRDGIDFRGTLFIGLMHTADGIRVLEYNVRFGDPETQVVLPLLDGDFGELLRAAAHGDLAGERRRLEAGGAACCVVLAAPGYPGAPERGVALELPGELGEDAILFHAGTARDVDGALVSAGGRVLNAVAVADELSEAVAGAYRLADAVGFPGAQLRRDIGS